MPDIAFNGMDDRYNSGQSQASGGVASETNYTARFGSAPSPLRSDIRRR